MSHSYDASPVLVSVVEQREDIVLISNWSQKDDDYKLDFLQSRTNARKAKNPSIQEGLSENEYRSYLLLFYARVNDTDGAFSEPGKKYSSCPSIPCRYLLSFAN